MALSPTYGFAESASKLVTLPEHSTRAIEAMLQVCYHGHYNRLELEECVLRHGTPSGSDESTGPDVENGARGTEHIPDGVDGDGLREGVDSSALDPQQPRLDVEVCRLGHFVMMPALQTLAMKNLKAWMPMMRGLNLALPVFWNEVLPKLVDETYAENLFPKIIDALMDLVVEGMIGIRGWEPFYEVGLKHPEFAAEFIMAYSHAVCMEYEAKHWPAPVSPEPCDETVSCVCAWGCRRCG